jgi:alkaline phosphatase D
MVGAAAASAGPVLARQAGAFRHGIASGDPASGSIVLWTRITTAEDAVVVYWQLALDAGFQSIVRSGRTVARRDRDHTVKVVPDRLAAGETYYYRFQALGEASPVGRTRTLPTGRVERLGIALLSCSNYSLGYFTAYDAVSRDPAIDFVLHTGDYIYEYGEAFSRQSKDFVRPADPPHETVSLDDYRRRHAIHKADPASQRMHAALPLMALWDDHEIANDSWFGGAQNHQPGTEGNWRARRDAAVRAYYEWMPVREPAAGQSRLNAWRTYRFGDLATLVTLETRLTARARPIDYREHKATLETAEGRTAFLRDVLGDRKRRMLSGGMRAALGRALASSVRDRQPWRLIGSGVLMARVFTPDFVGAGIQPTDYPEIGLLDRFTDLIWRARRNLPDDLGAWDGYAGARQAFYQQCQDAGARDLLVLSGDSHMFWANALIDDAGRRMGVELGTAGASIQSELDMAGFRPALTSRFDALYAAHNPDVLWRDSAHRGYVRVVLTPAAASADFVAVQVDRPEGYGVKVLRTERIVRQDDSLAFAGAPA